MDPLNASQSQLHTHYAKLLEALAKRATAQMGKRTIQVNLHFPIKTKNHIDALDAVWHFPLV